MVYNFTVWLRSETSLTGSRQQWKEQWYISRTPPAQHPPARTQLATGWWTQPGISAKVPDSCRVKPSTHVKASRLTNPGVVFPSQPIRAGACDYCRVIWHGTKCRSYISGFFCQSFVMCERGITQRNTSWFSFSYKVAIAVHAIINDVYYMPWPNSPH